MTHFGKRDKKPLNFGAMLHPFILHKTMVILLYTTTFFFGIISPKIGIFIIQMLFTIFWKVPIWTLTEIWRFVNQMEISFSDRCLENKPLNAWKIIVDNNYK